MPELLAEGSSPPKAGQSQSLEVFFSTALAGFAALVEPSALRTVLSLLAPPVGCVLVKPGRWVVSYRVLRWMADTPESQLARHIRDAEKRLRRKNLSPAERRQLQEQVRQLREALHQHRLRQLEATVEKDK